MPLGHAQLGPGAEALVTGARRTIERFACMGRTPQTPMYHQLGETYVHYYLSQRRVIAVTCPVDARLLTEV